MAEITQTGVTGKTLTQYRTEITGDYLDIDASWNVLPESPDGQIIAIWSETLANLDEQVQYAYMARDPAAAVGQALDDIADYAGITRSSATPSTATVTVSGVAGTVVPAGKRVRQSLTGTVWRLDADVTIPGSVNVTAVEPGALTAPQDTLTQIVDPVPGWQSVTNADAAAMGRDIESDTQFRQRRNLSVARPSQNQVDSIFADVGNVDGVTQVRIYENYENTPDANGLAGHSIAIFVQGGEIADVQSAILVNKNPGCGMNRNTGFPNPVQGDVTSSTGSIIPITFFRPDTVTVHVAVTINTTQMPESAKDEIKQVIVDYANEGYTGAGSGFTQRGFRIGEIIAAGKLFTPVNEIVGGRGYVQTIYVDSVDPPAGQIVNVAFNELGVFDIANIDVAYTS